MDPSGSLPRNTINTLGRGPLFASLTEQRNWARLIVQTLLRPWLSFVRVKQNLRAFKDAACLKVFDAAFENESNYRILWRIGFTPEQIDQLMQTARKEIKEFHDLDLL